MSCLFAGSWGIATTLSLSIGEDDLFFVATVFPIQPTHLVVSASTFLRERYRQMELLDFR